MTTLKSRTVRDKRRELLWGFQRERLYRGDVSVELYLMHWEEYDGTTLATPWRFTVYYWSITTHLPSQNLYRQCAASV